MDLIFDLLLGVSKGIANNMSDSLTDADLVKYANEIDKKVFDKYGKRRENYVSSGISMVTDENCVSSQTSALVDYMHSMYMDDVKKVTEDVNSYQKYLRGAKIRDEQKEKEHKRQVDEQSEIWKNFQEDERKRQQAYELKLKAAVAEEERRKKIYKEKIKREMGLKPNSFALEKKDEVGDTKDSSASWGEKGEQIVDYHLKWLGSSYKSVDKDCLNNGRNVILLKKADFMDEKQEIDHILVSEHGVYIIETKYFKGKTIIKKNGNWVRVEGENETGTQSPVAQVDRHHALLGEILKGLVEEQDIHDIICLAHDTSVIEGEENCPIPIRKMDVLTRYIKEIDAKSLESKYDIEAIIERINQYKVK